MVTLSLNPFESLELLEPIGSIWNGTIEIWSFIYGHWNPNLGPHFFEVLAMEEPPMLIGNWQWEMIDRI